METQTPPTPDTAQLALIQKKLNLDNRFRNGMNWFYWIAGLSILNSIIYMAGSSVSFVVGLGATQVVDGFTSAMANDLVQDALVIHAFGFAIDVFIAGLFILFGFLGRKHQRWAMITGLVLYVLDGIFLAVVGDIFSVIFHGLALYGIWMGMQALSQLEKLESTTVGESVEAIRQQLSTIQQPTTTPQQRRTRWIIVGLILLVILAFILITALQG